MSETLQLTPEQPREQSEVTAERPRPSAETGAEREAAKTEQLEQAHAALAAVEQTAVQPAAPVVPVVDRPTFIDNAVKTLRLRQSLQKVQSKLNPGDKALSKVVHQPLVRAVSDASAKTVSRPSGLLGGGILAFVGSLTYWLLAKQIGFHYNYLVFVLLFISGFILGLLIELMVRGSRRLKA